MTQEVNVDLIVNGKASGGIATSLQTSGALNINNKRPYLDDNNIPCITVFTGKHRGGATNPENYEAVYAKDMGIAVNAETTLRPEEWEQLDAAVEEVAREELVVWDYFVSQGLTKPLRNAYGTSVLRWQSISDSQEAIMSMDGVNRGQGDRVQYKDNYWPVPIMSVDYEIGARFLAISRANGNGVDTEEAMNAARRIMEKKEDMLVGTGTYTFGGGTMYTLLNFPSRNTVTLNGAWDSSSTTAANILDDVRALKLANKAALHRRESVLIIPSEYEDKLSADYSVSGGSLMTIKERIMKLGGIRDIIVSERLEGDNVILVELQKRTIEIIEGMPLQNVRWETEGGTVAKHKVMEIALPRLKADYNGNCGISHGSV